MLLEGEVVDEEDETLPAPAQDLEHPRQLSEVLFLYLHQPQPFVRVLVHDGFDGGRLAGPRQAVKERVVGRKPG